MTPLQKALPDVSGIGEPEFIPQKHGCPHYIKVDERIICWGCNRDFTHNYKEIEQAARVGIEQFSAGAMEVRERAK